MVRKCGRPSSLIWSFAVFEDGLQTSPCPTTPTNSPHSSLSPSPESSPGPHPDTENHAPWAIEPEDMLPHRLSRSRASLPYRASSAPVQPLQQITTVLPPLDRAPLSELGVYRGPVSSPMPAPNQSGSDESIAGGGKATVDAIGTSTIATDHSTDAKVENDSQGNTAVSPQRENVYGPVNSSDNTTASPQEDADPDSPIERHDIEEMQARFQQDMKEIGEREQDLMSQAANLSEMFTAYAAAMPVSEESRAKAR